MVRLAVIAVLLSQFAFAQTGEKLFNQLDQARLEAIEQKVPGQLLTDDQVRDAIKFGNADENKSGEDIGLRLEDTGQKWSNAFASMDNKNQSSRYSEHSGFAVRLLTPRTWVAWRAHEAKRVYKPYGFADVSESDRIHVLRIVVIPDTPAYVVAGSGMRASSSVEHVVLRTVDEKDVVQPLDIEPYQLDAKNAMGGSAGYSGVIAFFSMEDVARLRKADSKGEFLVTVVGERGKEKTFKVKRKHFEQLGN